MRSWPMHSFTKQNRKMKHALYTCTFFQCTVDELLDAHKIRVILDLYHHAGLDVLGKIS